MTAQDQRDFTAMMAAVFSIYDREINEGMIGFYFNALIDYPLSSVKEAFMQHTNDPDRGQYWPKPADVVRHISGGKGTQALAAWDTALSGVRGIGAYGTVKFSDPLILAVIDRMGGWPTFCEMDEDEKPFKQREFIERYTAYLTRPPSNVPKSLPGIAEAQNVFGGWSGDLRAQEAARPLQPGDPKPRLQPVERPALPSGVESRAVKPIPGMASLRKLLASPPLDEAGTAEAKAQQKHALEVWLAQAGKEAVGR